MKFTCKTCNKELVQHVHCLECDEVYIEQDPTVEVCPSCHNADKMQTVYLEHCTETVGSWDVSIETDLFEDLELLLSKHLGVDWTWEYKGEGHPLIINSEHLPKLWEKMVEREVVK